MKTFEPEELTLGCMEHPKNYVFDLYNWYSPGDEKELGLAEECDTHAAGHTSTAPNYTVCPACKKGALVLRDEEDRGQECTCCGKSWTLKQWDYRKRIFEKCGANKS